ncbi:MAG: alpha/beta hydrolase fold domain-containing protein [Oscillospiraceae bacterium]|nr:alpha/beta hydrolase fold domain-containing protein [Oscillospiraceae bacterium]
MRYETITLDEKRNVTLTAMLQGTGGEFRGLDARPAVVVIPGGGYRFCSDREADPVAAVYLRAGYHVFILRYSVGEDAAWPRPLQDYEEAMAFIDGHAEDWHVLRDKVAVVGFSAGGHLAGAAATMAERRPAAAVLGYAVLRGETAHELGEDKPDITAHVDGNTCPCFLFATRTDSVVPIGNTLDMMDALDRFQISFECHIYPYGPHGFSTGDPSVQGPETIFPRRGENWTADSVAFLRDLFGDFSPRGMTEPMLRPHVNDDAMAWLSLDCSIARIFGNPEARRVLAPVIEIMRRRIVPFTPEMSFEDMMQALGRMTLRELLAERGIETERFEELNAALRQIPNI